MSTILNGVESAVAGLMITVATLIAAFIIIPVMLIAGKVKVKGVDNG